MKPLILDGFGYSIKTSSDSLIIEDRSRKAEISFVDFTRKYNSLFICNRFGSISASAFNWLIQADIPIYFLSPEGSIMGFLIHNRSVVNGSFRLKQYQAYMNPERRKQIAEQFVNERRRQIEEIFKIKGSDSYPYNLLPEHIFTLKLFNRLKPEFESTGLSFGNRKSYMMSINYRAKSEINALLNFGYSVLEGICRKRLSFTSLDLSIGFLHTPCKRKESLVYDFQELGRTTVEKEILNLIKLRQIKKNSFYRLEDMTVRLYPETIELVSKTLIEEFERIRFEKYLSVVINNLIRSIEKNRRFFITPLRVEAEAEAEALKPSLQLQR